MNKKGKILIIDDNEDILFALNALLSKYVGKVKVSTKPESIPRFMEEFEPDIILLDMNFTKEMSSGKEGFDWLDKILRIDSEAIVIMMTAYADTEKAVQAIKAGAADFISKPWDNDKLQATVVSALRLKDSRNEVAGLKSQLQALNTGARPDIIGQSPRMEEVFTLIEKMSSTEANVLILGENGTGKDLIAHTIHNHSPRAGRIFTTIDLGSISETLFESELFGYEKGAFTDARSEKPGRIEAASGGTLFLDEIANLSLAMQSKLLTTIEKKYISRLGSVKNRPVDVRFIAATNSDIYKGVDEGRFRQDLLYRINTIEIKMPPLRERGNDVILLANYFLEKFCHKYKKEIKGISSDAGKKLSAYHWPGNVRELQNILERAVILSAKRSLQADDLAIQSNLRSRKPESRAILNLKQLEQDAIEHALMLNDGNMNRAAEALGISRFALYRKLKDYGVK